MPETCEWWNENLQPAACGKPAVGHFNGWTIKKPGGFALCVVHMKGRTPMPRQKTGPTLFHIQDDDRPMYVVAETWAAALSRWKLRVRAENDGDEGGEPNGITMVCDPDELLS